MQTNTDIAARNAGFQRYAATRNALAQNRTVVVPEGVYKGQAFTNPQPFPLDADGADFRDHGDRILLASLLASLGIFSVDKTPHRNKRYGQKLRAERIALAYQYLGLDQQFEYARIAGEVAPLYPEGIWPTSTGEYTRRRAARDAEVLRLAQEEAA